MREAEYERAVDRAPHTSSGPVCMRSANGATNQYQPLVDDVVADPVLCVVIVVGLPRTE